MTTPPEKPRRAADHLGWALILTAIAAVALGVAGEVGGDPFAFHATVALAGIAALYCWVVGVYRLASHSDRAAERAWQAHQDAL